ncbi:hypothetical protein LAV79_12785 [Peribacillus butanolivorans]|uniref:hypothetical protein n=1 Tax=Peribacillus butanolivorans TaxID=421767 RepID=UPI0030C9815B
MKKLSSLFCVMVLSLIGVFSFGTEKASAFGVYFETEDGEYEASATTTSTNRNIKVKVDDLLRTNGYGASQAYPSNLL